MKTIFTVFLMVTTALGLAQKQFVNYFENGNILEKGTLVDGKRNGNYTSYFLNGNIKTNEKYTRGIVIQKKEYKADGVLVLTSYMINGSSKMQVYKYNSSGKLESEGFEDLNGLKVGEWIYYDENKNQIKIENYKSGERIKG